MNDLQNMIADLVIWGGISYEEALDMPMTMRNKLMEKLNEKIEKENKMRAKLAGRFV